MQRNCHDPTTIGVHMTFKASAKSAAERLGVADEARDAYRKFNQAINVDRRKRNARFLERGAPDGLPTPPETLVYYVAGHNDYDIFWIDGAAHARNIRDTFASVGVDISNAGTLLDWGCGCGRVLRHWAELNGPALCGSDYNSELVNWCQQNLPFADVRSNALDPPLLFDTGWFDALFAVSVFTHLDAARQEPWLAEVARVLKPGGTALLTIHGNSSRNLLTPVDRARFDAGELVVHAPDNSGENVCTAYHPSGYIRTVFGRYFDVLDIVDTPLRGSVQDAVLVRRNLR